MKTTTRMSPGQLRLFPFESTAPGLALKRAEQLAIQEAEQRPIQREQAAQAARAADEALGLLGCWRLLALPMAAPPHAIRVFPYEYGGWTVAVFWPSACFTASVAENPSQIGVRCKELDAQPGLPLEQVERRLVAALKKNETWGSFRWKEDQALLLAWAKTLPTKEPSS